MAMWDPGASGPMAAMVFLLLALTALLVAAGMLMKSAPFHGMGNIIFAWHPVLMAMAFLPLMGGAIFSHKLRSVDASAKRAAHGLLNAAGLLCAALGYAAIYKAHADKGVSQFAVGAKSGRQAHVYLGYTVLFLVLLQGLVGMRKYQVVAQTGERLHRWHGKLGRPVFALCLVNVVLGVWFGMDNWTIAFKVVLTVLVALCGILVLEPGVLCSSSVGGPGMRRSLA